jgi:hypothetical protein
MKYFQLNKKNTRISITRIYSPGTKLHVESSARIAQGKSLSIIVLNSFDSIISIFICCFVRLTLTSLPFLICFGI